MNKDAKELIDFIPEEHAQCKKDVEKLQSHFSSCSTTASRYRRAAAGRSGPID
jgi:hypothetical protein